MDQYLSTYRKDFIWPYVRTMRIRTSPSYSERALQAKQPYRRIPCTCGAEPGGLMPPKEYVGPLDAEAHQWSRLGPMAPLLDPKLYPAKMGPAPEFEITRYDQPNTYLKKLNEKYPYLYNVLQNAPPDDMIRRVNEDRLRTTYQVDYSHMDEHPSADYEKLLAKAGISDWSNKIPCSKEVPAVLDCRANIRPPIYSGQNLEQSSRNAPNDLGHRTDLFDDYPEDAHRGVGFRNESDGFREGFREVTNDRDGFRNNDRGFGDFRDTNMDRGDFRMIEDRGDDRGDIRNDAARFGDFREAMNDRGGFRVIENQRDDRGGFRMIENRGNYRGDFRNDAARVGDFREVTNDRGGYRNDPGGFRDTRDAANVREGFREDAGRPARDYGDSGQVATIRGGDNRGDSGRSPNEAGSKNIKSSDGGGGGSGGGSGSGGPAGKTTDTGGFGSADGDDGKPKRAGKVIIEDLEALKKPLPAWRSEYQEVIGQTGYDILRDKMHQHGARSRGRNFIERIIMKCRA